MQKVVHQIIRRIKAIRHPSDVARLLDRRIALTRNKLFRVTPTSHVGNRSASDNLIYPDFCLKAALSSKIFQSFKRSSIYRQILEHASYEEGKECLVLIQKESADFLKDQIFRKVLLNDCVGNPIRFDYGPLGSVAPTTLRYLRVCSNLTRLFGDLSGFHIAEIGVGYGGQLLVLDQIWATKTYAMFDLNPVLMLVVRYLENFILNTTYRPLTINQFAGSDSMEFDLVVSNYAFSELPRPLQEQYLQKIVRKSKRGYLTMNSGKDRASGGGVYGCRVDLRNSGKCYSAGTPAYGSRQLCNGLGPRVRLIQKMTRIQ